jgi:cytoskeletal protein CcmA (bactofilin family)
LLAALGRQWGDEMPDNSRHSVDTQASRKIRDSTIGEDLRITGNVSSKGEIHLDGEVHGDVSCVALVLGESATLEGNVTAEDVVIRGRLVGSVKALRVTLQSMSHVEGDIYHQSLALEQGAYFEGRSRRSDDPMGAGHAASTNGSAKASEPEEPASQRKDKPTHKFTRSLSESHSA